MDFSKLAQVNEQQAPVVRQDNHHNPVADAINHRRTKIVSRTSIVSNPTRPQRRVLDSKKYTVEQIMDMSREERRRVLGRMSDSERRIFLDKWKKVKDDAQEHEFFQILANHLTTQIIEMTGAEDDLKEDLKSSYLTDDMKEGIKKVLSMEPIARDEVSEVFAALKDKFKAEGIANPPFVLLSDSFQEVLNASSKKVADAAPVEEAIKDNESDDDDSSTDEVPDFDSIDENGDGTISREEWTAAGQDEELFDIIDADSNGEISREEFDSFYNDTLEDDDDEKPLGEEVEDGDPHEDENSEDNPEDNPEDSAPHMTFEEMSQVVHAVDEFLKTGNRDVFKDLTNDPPEKMQDSLKRLQDGFDQDGNFVLSEEEYDKIKEDIEEELKEKGVKLPDSIPFKSFEHTVNLSEVKVKDMVSVPCTADEYHYLMDGHMRHAAIALAKVLDSQVVIPFNKHEVKDGLIKVTTGNYTQTWIPTIKVSDSLDQKWVKDNCVSTESFRKAAGQLGFAPIIDSRFYKKHINDDGYCTDPCKAGECACTEIVPEDVKTVIQSLPEGTNIVLVLTQDEPCENCIASAPCNECVVPLDNYHMSVCQA